MSDQTPLILITNDDGVSAPGIIALSSALKGLGRIVVIAPQEEMSGCSRSITLTEPIRIANHENDFYSVRGTPTDCINVGIQHILKTLPDLVVSGINRGANLGGDVFYSGTVAGAMEAVYRGIPAFSISLVYRTHKEILFDPAAEFARKFATFLLREPFEKNVFFNVNVPSLPQSQMSGVQVTRLGKKMFHETLEERFDPRGNKYFWVAGRVDIDENDPHTDCGALANQAISVTPLKMNIDHPLDVNAFQAKLSDLNFKATH
jgi:5'-nucleotidase